VLWFGGKGGGRPEMSPPRSFLKVGSYVSRSTDPGTLDLIDYFWATAHRPENFSKIRS